MRADLLNRLWRSVAVRLGAMFLSVVLLVAVPLTLWFDHHARNMVEENAREAATALLREDRGMLRLSVTNRDHWHLFNVVEAVSSPDHVVEAGIIDSEGKVLAHSRPTEVPVESEWTPEVDNSTERLPIEGFRGEIGALYIVWDMDALTAGFNPVRDATFAVALASSLLAAGVGAWVAVRLRNRLRRIVARSHVDPGRRPPVTPQEAAAAAADRPRAGDELDTIEGQLVQTLDQLTLSQWLLDSVDDIVLLTDREGMIRHGNSHTGVACPCSNRCTGATLEQVLGASIWWQIRQDVHGGRSGTLEAELTLGERTFPALIAYRPRGRMAIIKVTDLTEYRQLKERVEKMQALSTLGEMSTELAHEIKNNIVPVRLLCDVAPLERDDREAIFRSLDHIQELVSDVMAFGRGDQQPSQPVVLSEAVAAWTAILDGEAEARGVTIERAVTDRVVEIPAGGLRIVYTNLVRNAIQALPEGGTVRVHGEVDRRGALLLRVSDDGPGIPEHVREQLFEPFATSKPEGTGLGLALVHRYVTAAGGHVVCDSEPGAGTTFTVHWPGAAEPLGRSPTPYQGNPSPA